MEKRYTVKVYSQYDEYRGSYGQLSGYEFDKVINGGLAELNITVPDKFDEYGFGDFTSGKVPVNLLDRVEIWVQDKDTSGRIIYSGYVSGMTQNISEGQESVSLSLMGYVARLGYTLDRDGTTISIERNSTAIGYAVDDILGAYQTNTGAIVPITYYDTRGAEYVNWDGTKDVPVKTIDEYKFNSSTYMSLYYGDLIKIAQSYEVFNTSLLYRTTFKVKKIGNPVGTLKAEIYVHSGTYGTSSVPDGASWAVSTTEIDVATLPNDETEISLYYPYSGGYQDTVGYSCLGLTFTTGSGDSDIDNCINVKVTESGSGTHGGNVAVYDSSWTAEPNYDLWFTHVGNMASVEHDYNKVISYTSNTKSCMESIERLRQMAGENYWWYVGADNVLYFKPIYARPIHTFTFGKDIASLKVVQSTDDIKNQLVFWNQLQPDDTNYISKLYYSQNSIDDYWERYDKLTDGRITDATTADELGTAYINSYKNPNVSLTFDVKDNNYDDGYDIESIEPGDTCKILNIHGENVLGESMLITGVHYTPEKATVYVSDLRSITGRSLTEIRRRLDTEVYGDGVETVTEDNIDV